MRFNFEDDARGFRTEVQAFVAQHVTDDLHVRMELTGTQHDPGFSRALGERGWIASGWPIDEGGGALSLAQQRILFEELRRAQAPLNACIQTMLVANTLRVWGADEHRDLLHRVARGDVVIALGYSEPGGGSDVAAARTRAVLVDDGWVVDGEKMFTTLAEASDFVFLVARTAPDDVPKHERLTMFLIPITAPGVTVSPLATLGGERTNITTYHGVRAPDEWRVGPVNGGWSVLATALDFERDGIYGIELRRVLGVAVREAGSPDVTGRRLLDDPVARARLARIAIDDEVAELLSLQSDWLWSTGKRPVVEGAMAKLYSTEAFARACSQIMDLFGADALAQGGGLRSSGLGVIEHAYRHSQVTRIYAGASEIQRSIVAERGLGLPRTRPS